MSLTTVAAIATGAGLMCSGTPLRGADNQQDTTGKTEQHGQFSRKDYKFIHDAAQGGLLEVKLGELAKEKGSIQSVKEFGDRMIKDHSKANDELKQLATQKGAAIPDQLGRHEEREWEHMQKLTGKDFDKAYADHMLKDHKKDIKEFQDAAKDAQDADVKAFAQKTLPTLQQHEQLAEQMESSVKQQQP
jgi:putative membrane protein